MNDPYKPLCPNKQEVAAKIMDGEAIIINLSTGLYYSMDGVGALIWEMVEEGFSIKGCVEALVEQYDVSPEKALEDVKRLVRQLLEEGLIYVLEQEGPPQNNRRPSHKEKLSYDSPCLNVYRDMEDLLALDPPMPSLSKTPWKKPNEERD